MSPVTHGDFPDFFIAAYYMYTRGYLWKIRVVTLRDKDQRLGYVVVVVANIDESAVARFFLPHTYIHTYTERLFFASSAAAAAAVRSMRCARFTVYFITAPAKTDIHDV